MNQRLAHPVYGSESLRVRGRTKTPRTISPDQTENQRVDRERSTSTTDDADLCLIRNSLVS